MDRRQQKTRDAIFLAFTRLLEIKRYSHITVQDIIDEANIGRSTFYAHFETKDELLKAMCTQIFGHIFSNELLIEQTHDFSSGSKSLQARLTHLLYHLKDSKKDITSILSSDSSNIFMRYFKDYLTELFSKYNTEANTSVPDDFLLNHYVSSFAEAVKWWAKKDMSYSPEDIAEFYVSAIR